MWAALLAIPNKYAIRAGERRSVFAICWAAARLVCEVVVVVFIVARLSFLSLCLKV